VNVILEYKLKKGITTPALARLVAKIDAIARRKVGFLAFDTSIKPNPEHQTLGAYLIYLRKQTQLEQQHIAKKCGMGRGTLSQLENDVYKKPLQNATLSRLAIGYGGDIREIQRLARR
jgi:DNA-binding XRE family transcriptional regulator